MAKKKKKVNTNRNLREERELLDYDDKHVILTRSLSGTYKRATATQLFDDLQDLSTGMKNPIVDEVVVWMHPNGRTLEVERILISGKAPMNSDEKEEVKEYARNQDKRKLDAAKGILSTLSTKYKIVKE